MSYQDCLTCGSGGLKEELFIHYSKEYGSSWICPQCIVIKEGLADFISFYRKLGFFVQYPNLTK